MAFEIIRRKEGEMSDKQTFRHDNTQISINDWGHLVIRQFDNTHNSEEYLFSDFRQVGYNPGLPALFKCYSMQFM